MKKRYVFAVISILILCIVIGFGIIKHGISTEESEPKRMESMVQEPENSVEIHENTEVIADFIPNN